MRKKVFGRRLKRDKDERKALLKSLMSSLVLEERIKTTEAKAKSIQGQVEKLVTKAKKSSNGVCDLNKFLIQKASEKLVREIAPRFLERNGGYTRIVRLGKRMDGSEMVLIEWVERKKQDVILKTDKKENSKSEKKEVKKSSDKRGRKVKEVKKKERRK